MDFLHTTVILAIALAAPFVIARILLSHVHREELREIGRLSSAQVDTITFIRREAQKRRIHVTVNPSGNDSENFFNHDTKAIFLSPLHYNSKSIVSLAIAAHEFGHALQHNQNYKPIRVRHVLEPFCLVAYIVMIIVMWVGFSAGNALIAAAGILGWLAALAVQINTVRSEFDASNRAIRLLYANGFNQNELDQCRRILRLCAMTYVAGILTTVSTSIIILIAMAMRSQDD